MPVHCKHPFTDTMPVHCKHHFTDTVSVYDLCCSVFLASRPHYSSLWRGSSYRASRPLTWTLCVTVYAPMPPSTRPGTQRHWWDKSWSSLIWTWWGCVLSEPSRSEEHLVLVSRTQIEPTPGFKNWILFAFKSRNRLYLVSDNPALSAQLTNIFVKRCRNWQFNNFVPCSASEMKSMFPSL